MYSDIKRFKIVRKDIIYAIKKARTLDDLISMMKRKYFELTGGKDPYEVNPTTGPQIATTINVNTSPVINTSSSVQMPSSPSPGTPTQNYQPSFPSPGTPTQNYQPSSPSPPSSDSIEKADGNRKCPHCGFTLDQSRNLLFCPNCGMPSE
ncbi:MAG: hypothetical protein ACTSYB_03460 [Candidatus Helarchaeota archaeon]